MLLPILACLPVQLDVEGLAEGERARWLAPAATVSTVSTTVSTRSGRVVDAFTGRPVVGACVEAWTEEIAPKGAGLRRVGEARTDGGGSS